MLIDTKCKSSDLLCSLSLPPLSPHHMHTNHRIDHRLEETYDMKASEGRQQDAFRLTLTLCSWIFYVRSSNKLSDFFSLLRMARSIEFS